MTTASGGLPELSVVVCSRNGAKTLPGTLAHLSRQSLPRSRYEVIVVDDGSTDATAQIARAGDAAVVSLAPSRGLAGARNAGVQVAAAATVAFTDDDRLPDRDWLAAVASALSDPGVDGVGGKVVPACANDFLLGYLQANNPLTPLGGELLVSDRAVYRLGLYLKRALARCAGPAPGSQMYSVVGANMAFRRELLVGLGGFDEAFRFGGEEEDLCRRAHARPGGVRLTYAPEAVVVHQFDPRVRDSLRRARAYGIGHTRGALKHGDRRPIVYPFPLLVASAMLLALRTRRAAPLALGALAPLAAYAAWPAPAWRRRSSQPLAYPYLQLAEETCTMLGELQGRLEGAHLHDRAPLSVVPQAPEAHQHDNR